MIKPYNKLDNLQKGIILGVIAALISGFAVFINKKGIAYIADSGVYTTLKNTTVALIVIAILFFLGRFKDLNKLKNKDWILLFLIGAIGGSIPFLLFFKGLSLSESAFMPALIHKTLFIWVSILATIFLKERIGKIQIAALALLLIGNILILGWPKSFSFSSGEILVFLATVFWAIENIIAKYALKSIPTNFVIFGRMFFGSLILLLFLILSGKTNLISNISTTGWLWIMIVSAILFGYVTFWYNALKKAPASLAASVLVVASLVTSILVATLQTHQYKPTQIIGSLLIVLAIILIILLSKDMKWKRLSKQKKMA